MLLSNFVVILVKPRFPENIGMAARACANMGCPALRLVRPEHWDFLKAEPTATGKGTGILRQARHFDSLASALADCNAAFASSARTGTKRGSRQTPEQAAREMADLATKGCKVALVFGPEDRGLENQELRLCQDVIRIPANDSASSLNLAQAALIILYECRKAMLPKRQAARAEIINLGEWQLLAQSLKEILSDLDCPAGRNPDYYFRQWTGLLKNGRLSRQEYDTLMGFCRQIRKRLG